MGIVTPFRARVYEALKLIPCGRVTTYKELARYLQCNSAQAIGQALRHNPFAPEVPCHRVITSGLTIGGYSGETEGPVLRKKVSLLASEGVHFDSQGKLREESLLWQFEMIS